MRVLFALNPEKTIFQYMVTTAWALRTAGHEVHVASQPWFADTITQAGLTAVPVGGNRDPWRITAHRPDLLAQMRVGHFKPYDAFDDPTKATWEYLRPGIARAAAGFHRVANFPIIAELVEYARHWRPDLVVWDALSYAGSIAAQSCGAAHARLLFGVDVYGGVRQLYRQLNAAQPEDERADPIADWFAGYGRRYGFDFTEDLFTGHFTIDQLPRSLQVEADLEYVRTRYVPYGGPAVVPRWLFRPPERPRIGLTMGVSATEIFRGYAISMADVLAALADLDVEVVATVAADQQAGLGALSANVRLVSYVPWHALVPSCSVVVNHAGAATLATTALYPVPQLALHHHADQPILGRLLAEQGAGLELPTTLATGESVRAAVLRLLGEPTFGLRAAALTAEIEALPTPNEIVPRLEELTVKHRAGTVTAGG
ncbi:activator-dependent family glycosyltransferase [Micromonospora sp. NPDC047793]|uniref:activator-dependent family glycosyltransferase n=1 Tax=unclassified Micromonospora TaxID=2617518 RepID=UPI001033D029|nr:activator-dependent family glycosyltransferase [Verrucosispora sp. SN26_14.1]TBL45477.1 activator-dependent family glycosyltransferase [Verrucosispora sp. SN26_14.1]